MNSEIKSYLMNQPEDSTYLDLGKFIWHFINLEDRALSLIQLVTFNYQVRGIGLQLAREIDDSKKFIFDNSHIPAISELKLWLDSVEIMSKKRNSILHGTPVIGYQVNSTLRGDNQKIFDGVIHMNRRGNRTDLQFNEDTLEELTNEMIRLNSLWKDLALKLYNWRGEYLATDIISN